MLSAAIFGVSLLGLIALFGCKALELSGNVRTPLTRIRRVGDPLVSSGLLRCTVLCRTLSFAALQTSANWLQTTVRKTRISVDVALHALTARLNRYLRGRRVEMRVNGEPSARLKTVLEKTNDTTPPASF